MLEKPDSVPYEAQGREHMFSSSPVCENRCIMSEGGGGCVTAAGVCRSAEPPSASICVFLYLCIEIPEERRVYSCVWLYELITKTMNNVQTWIYESLRVYLCALIFYCQTVCFLFAIFKQGHYLIPARLDKSIRIMFSDLKKTFVLWCNTPLWETDITASLSLSLLAAHTVRQRVSLW